VVHRTHYPRWQILRVGSSANELLHEGHGRKSTRRLCLLGRQQLIQLTVISLSVCNTQHPITYPNLRGVDRSRILQNDAEKTTAVWELRLRHVDGELLRQVIKSTEV
jgi:hypothetical protein